MKRRSDNLMLWMLRRAASAALLLWLLMSAVFWVVRLAPGNPLDQMTNADMSEEDRLLVRRRLGLDEPVGAQYLRWAGAVLRGDWGDSISQHRPVARILSEAVPATLLLTVSAYVLHLVLALLAGMAMAVRRGRSLERWLNIGGLILYSLPSFWFGLMLILVGGVKLGWFPLGGMHAPDAVFMGPVAAAADTARHLVLPVIVLAFGSYMSTARFLRASLEDVLGQDYILAARARGVPERRVLWHHALRNGLLPVMTQIGLHIPFLLGGAVVVEAVFGWPGMGRVTIEAIWSRDYPLIMATTFMASSLVVIGSMLADLGYQLLDPRIRLASRAGQT